ncbi:MAG TPA: LysR substrate-binding domain-containing protein, partial [Polyangiaceae bacterium]
ADHGCINYRLASGKICEWEFKADGKPKKFMPQGKSSFNDPDLVLSAVLQGQGIAQLAGYQICDSLHAGQLRVCLTEYAPADRAHYLCYLSRQHLPARVRVFIDYMTIHTRAVLQSSTMRIQDRAQ